LKKEREFKAKVFVNKKTKQVSISIPKKLVRFGKVPKLLEVKIKW